MDAVKSIFSTVFKVPLEKIIPETSMDNLREWNSLNHLELMMALESEFGVKFTMHELRSLRTVADIARILEERGS